MPAQWLSNSSDIGARAGEWFESAAHYLSRPDRARRLRQGVLLLLLVWLVLSLARLVWALLPLPEPEPGFAETVINPASTAGAGSAREPVDIDLLRGRHLFGEAGAAALAEALPQPEAEPESAREGIEKGARETRLQLTLRGIVAADHSGLGHAIIEHKNRQAVYAVEDKLPVAGDVVLAKVMPRQVVLDNNGTYELLSLFDDSELDAQANRPAAPAPRPASGGAQVDKRDDADATRLASGYRERLYKNPQSLAEVVTVQAVRQDGQLLGYRVSPGKEREEFVRLGFKPGDLVTGINGISLDNPANTMELYQTMRTAGEAVFDLRRGDETLSLAVSLDGG